ncbi:methyltransferase [Streptacidiphilus monticola]|uniref:Ribosomal RNA large subunit methyltransferase G n=1 Tax=Streptacidiphilus monticola TaxID=2161674 RepID=A0ABW1G2G4_9ACTN
MNQLSTPWGDLLLSRYPASANDPLRAWDAADEYLLRALAGLAGRTAQAEPKETGAGDEPVELTGRHLTVLGDRWGALTAALARTGAASLTQVSDSWLAQQATRANLAANGTDPAGADLRSTRDAPPPRIDVLLVRVPKSLSLLEDQLHRLAPALRPGSAVLGTGMVTEIHTSTLALFERILGPTRTTLAVRKARLVLTTPTAHDPGPSPWPLRYRLASDEPFPGLALTNHAGVFCADRLDIGTRFLLQHLPTGRRGTIVDLGCGNGVVGTAAALANPDAELLFVDESLQAVASAEETFRENVRQGRARFAAADALAEVPDASVDLVLNNPPFHSHQATTDATAWRMFTGARRALRPGGELWVVGNRHLGYHVKLKRLFGNCEVVAADRKFVVLRAVRRS